ncbi:MAG: hypothetical protein C3F11_18940 [Methylocystaceae bacterium]|nr:MAG: hypothetical protein C3F11_18940 [Methylocystaceae bacterium]
MAISLASFRRLIRRSRTTLRRGAPREQALAVSFSSSRASLAVHAATSSCESHISRALETSAEKTELFRALVTFRLFYATISPMSRR